MCGGIMRALFTRDQITTRAVLFVAVASLVGVVAKAQAETALNNLEICKSVAAEARNTMKALQAGVPVSKMMEIAINAEKETGATYYVSMVIEAAEVPKYRTEEYI